MNSQNASQANQAKWQEFIDAAKAKYAAATEAYNAAFSAANAHQSYVFFKKAQDAYDVAGAQWIADQYAMNCGINEVVAPVEVVEEVTAEIVSKDFATMTVEELREYAETVQAEYDADELSSAMDRQIVRDAWARVEQAELDAEVTA